MALGSNRDYVARDKAIWKALKKNGMMPEMWTCPDCGRKQWESETICPRCKHEREGKPMTELEKKMKKALTQKQSFLGVICRKDNKGMFVYSMQLAGGIEAVLRTSGRRYDLAHFYCEPVTGGNKKGLKRSFTFGKKPDRYYKELHAETYAIHHFD